MATLPGKEMLEETCLAYMKSRDADVEQILGSSPHVSMYIMSVDQQKWERKNVEGTLYVLKRRTNPRFQLMVLNKLSTENYLETIDSGFHSEVQAPYLIYTQGGGKVHAFWFYQEQDLDKVAALLSKVEAGLPKPAVLPFQQQQQQQAAPAPAPAPVAAAEDESGGGDDGGFWDKPKKAVKEVPPGHMLGDAQQDVRAANGDAKGENSITSLFKNMQIKQQQQGPPAAPAAGPLPPSFFLQQNTAPAASAAAATEAPNDNAISRLFAKQAPAPAAAPAPAPAPPAVAPTTKPGNALAALLTSAANKQQQVAPQPGTPTGGQQQQQHHHHHHHGGPPQPDDLLRVKVAMTRLVQREDFLAMVAEELRRAGI